MSNFKSICRCCAIEIESKKLTDLFTKIDDSLEIAEILSLCSNLTILRTDQRPQQICQTCRLDLWKAYSFLKKCQHSEICFQFQLPETIKTNYISELSSSNDNDCNSINVISSSEPNIDPSLSTFTLVNNANNFPCKEEIETKGENQGNDYQNIECREEFPQLKCMNIEPTTAETVTQQCHKPQQVQKKTCISNQSSQKKIADIINVKLSTVQQQSIDKIVALSKKSLTCSICRKYILS